MSNSKRIDGTVSSVMKKSAFLSGFLDKKYDMGFSGEYEEMTTNEQWDYERGRFFCIIYNARGFKKGREIA